MLTEYLLSEEFGPNLRLSWWLRCKESTCSAGDPGSIPGLGRSPGKKEMATHSSILAWKIPWMEEPGRLQSMGSQRIGHDWVTLLMYKNGCHLHSNCLRIIIPPLQMKKPSQGVREPVKNH